MTTLRRKALAAAPDAATSTTSNPAAAVLGRLARALARVRATRSTDSEPARPPGLLAGLHPLLFGIYPVLFLWSQNVGEVGPDDVGDAFGYVFVAAIVAMIGLSLIFLDRRRGALLVSPAILGFLLYGHIAELKVPPEVERGAWFAILAIALILALKLSTKWLGRVDTALFRIATLLVAVSLVSIVPTEVEEAMHPQPILAAGHVLPSQTTAQKRDVYWLVFDRYGSDRSFQLQFNVTNDMTPWLKDQGFTVLANSHANYVATALSMSTTLNMTPLDKLAAGVSTSSRSYAPTYSALQSPIVARQFQALGYRYLHLGSWWNPTRTDIAADKNFNADGVSDFTSVVVEESLIPEAMKALGVKDLPPSESEKHVKHNTYALDTLDRIGREPGPKFVLAHVLLPHPPYVFDRDGTYIPPDQAAKLDTADAWHRQLDYTNGRLKTFIAGLLAVPADRQPIIILQADEGPWPDRYADAKFSFDWRQATDRELEIKFGIMNAWYLPPGVDLQLSQTQTSINTFPILFDRYFGLDYPMLPDRVQTSRSWLQPYALIDITSRLSSLKK